MAVQATATNPEMVVQPPPAPWAHIRTYAIGGLFQVGYARDSDLLLVHSAQGRGLFDAVAGTRFARDDEEPMDAFDPIRLIAPGFDAIGEGNVHMAGLFGGGLPWTTLDGYRLEEHSPAWPRRGVVLIEPDEAQALVFEDGACELRAFGFSETGRSFVVATSCELGLFARPAEAVRASS